MAADDQAVHAWRRGNRNARDIDRPSTDKVTGIARDERHIRRESD
jgi:hypothetical protein